MDIAPGAIDRVVDRYREAGDPADADLVRRIATDLAEAAREGAGRDDPAPPPSPFAVGWMDSYLAHWELRREMGLPDRAVDDVSQLVRGLAEIRFEARLAEIRDILDRVRAPDGGPPEPGSPEPSPAPDPPDGGPPEPGVPPAGPDSVFAPPDGGTPEPGVPPVGPAGPAVAALPDGGPPEPGVPPVGPDSAFDPADNPWILYWFVSLKAPLLLDVVDAHLVRRLDELRSRPTAP